MELLKTLMIAVQIISGLLMITLVLLHSPKGDGVAGFGGTANLFSSQKGAEATLNRITAGAAIVFFLCSFFLGYYLF